MIIGIIGKAGSGKSTISDHLVLKHMFLHNSFASSLKESAKQIFGLSYAQLYGNEKDVIDLTLGITPRFILQQLGTEVARNIHKDTWLISLERNIEGTENLLGKEHDWVIDDVRFNNEAEWIRSKGGFLLKVTRDNSIDGIDSNHQSETEQDMIIPNGTIANDWTIEDLKDAVNLIIGNVYSGSRNDSQGA